MSWHLPYRRGIWRNPPYCGFRFIDLCRICGGHLVDESHREGLSCADAKNGPTYQQGGDGLGGPGETTRQYSVLIASILRYPEVASVAFDPRGRDLRTDFLVRRPLSDDEQGRLRDLWENALDAYAHLDGMECARRSLDVVCGERLTVVMAAWRAEELRSSEVALLIDFLRDLLATDLLADEEAAAGMMDETGEEELYMGEQLIAEKLADLSKLRGERSLIAFRDEGRLIVYHK